MAETRVGGGGSLVESVVCWVQNGVQLHRALSFFFKSDVDIDIVNGRSACTTPLSIHLLFPLIFPFTLSPFFFFALLLCFFSPFLRARLFKARVSATMSATVRVHGAAATFVFVLTCVCLSSGNREPGGIRNSSGTSARKHTYLLGREEDGGGRRQQKGEKS
jgi:uncharacterized membrane protein (DUF485 family)